MERRGVKQALQVWSRMPTSKLQVIAMCKYNFGDFAKPVSDKGVPIHDLNINPAEVEMYFMDLEPSVNPTPYMATEEMSLTKVS